jgi:hypothetical protein
MSNLILPNHTNFNRIVEDHIHSLIRDKSFDSKVGDDYWFVCVDKEGKYWDVNIWLQDNRESDVDETDRYQVTIYDIETDSDMCISTITDEWAPLGDFHDFIMETKKCN